MSVPDDATLNAVLAEITGLGLLSGSAADQSALAIAWELAEYGIGTNLLATGTYAQEVEEHYWPTGWNDAGDAYRMVALHKTRLISVDTILMSHEVYNCDCTVQEEDGCAVIYNARRSEIAMGGCWPNVCACSDRSRPFKAEIGYTAALFTALPFDHSVYMALGLLASWWSGVISSGGGSLSSGFIKSWRSMDYNESLDFVEKTVLGSNPQANAAWLLLRKYRIKRAIVIRSHFPHAYRREVRAWPV